MLDPRISYEGFKVNYGDDMMLLNHLEDSKTNLFDYFNEHYATLHSPTLPSPPPTAIQSIPMDESPVTCGLRVSL